LAQGFQNNGHQVIAVTLYGTDLDFYKLPDGVERLALNIAGSSPTLLHSLWYKVYRLWVLRRAIQSTQPDAIVSFIVQTNVITSLALTKTGYPIIATEHCDPTTISYGFIWEKLRRLTYPNIDRIVSVSKGVDRYFDWLPKAKRAVIYNPLAAVFLSSSRGESRSQALSRPFSSNGTKQSLVAMGRLTHQKGFDLLLQAMARLKDHHPEWTLTILGEGELRAELESLCESLGLCDRVHLPGVVHNPYEVLVQADIFVMASRFEGFGNVLIEAMACGLAVISTDCPSGPNEIISDGVNGILVPNNDVNALAAAMDRLMSDEGERKCLSARALEGVERFSLEKIMGAWEKLLAQVVEERL
jgi:glycosyltransferase involved in cell wall biosynthesis